MKFFLIKFSVILFFACNNSVNDERSNNHYNEKIVEDSAKVHINKFCIDKYPDSHIIALTFTRLYKSVILNVQPVYDNELFKNRGKPFSFYEFNKRLFLIYCGLEMPGSSAESTNISQVKFDSVCKKYGIIAQNTIHDTQPLFLEYKEDRLTEFTDPHFPNVFYSRILDTSKYIPAKL